MFRYVVARDGSIWNKTPFVQSRTGRHNIIRGAVDKVILPPGYQVYSPVDCFKLFITDSVCKSIAEYTNAEAKIVLGGNNNWQDIDEGWPFDYSRTFEMECKMLQKLLGSVIWMSNF